MITRGYYIGEIIDEFSAIAAQVKMRNRLGLTDLSLFTETFFRDVLNQILGAGLVNLNTERQNEPGLDLGDAEKKLAFQITATSTAAKVNKTLGKISADHKAMYEKFVVLVVGQKQKSYKLDAALSKSVGFSSKSIWDLDSLMKRAVDLPIDRLASLHRIVRAEVARVKVELEVPDEKGNYPTSGYSQWEERIKPTVGDGRAFAEFVAHHAEVSLDEINQVEIGEGVAQLGRKLARLPRVTREFLVMLIERRETKRSKRFHEGEGWLHLLYDKVEREFRGSDLKGEIGILDHADFVSVDGEDPYDLGPAEIGVRISKKSDDLAINFLDFVEAKKLSLRRVIGDGDLSDF